MLDSNQTGTCATPSNDVCFVPDSEKWTKSVIISFSAD